MTYLYQRCALSSCQGKKVMNLSSLADALSIIYTECKKISLILGRKSNILIDINNRTSKGTAR